MKKFLAIISSIFLVISTVACSNNSSNNTAATKSETSFTETTSESNGGKKTGSDYTITFLCMLLGDMSFADSGKRGLDQLEAEYGFKTKAIEAGTDSSKYESYVIDICESGTNFFLSTSEFQEEVENVASDYPEIKFMIFDVSRDVEVKEDNILYVSFAQNEGSYLVGMIAAAKSQSGVIGAVGGVQNPVICDFITGYVEGAKAYNPNINVITSWVGDWSDSAKMLELCTQQNSTYGTDVFFPIAGGAGLGAFEAALNISDSWSIGVDSDQHAIFAKEDNAYADVILTSMLKQVDKSFLSVFGDFLEGKEYWGTVRVLGVKEGGVDYVNNEILQENVAPEIIEAVEKSKQEIIDGTLIVKSYKDFASEQEYNDYISNIAP